MRYAASTMTTKDFVSAGDSKQTSMAFDRPIEADSVKDFGLLSSLIRAPVVGILWLLGGEQAKDEDDREKREENKSIPMDPRQLENAMDGGNYCKEGIVNAEGDVKNADNHSALKLGDVNVDDCDPPPASDTSSLSSVTQTPSIENKENKSSSPQRPMNSSIFQSKCKRRQNLPKNMNASPTSPSHDNSSHFQAKPVILDSDAAAEMIHDLVSVIERSHDRISNMAGPATKAFLTSHVVVASSSAVSLSASYSASTFSTSHPSQSINNGTYPSQLTQDDSNPSIRGNKKMSWSDEGGNRSLVEYFDESSRPPRSNEVMLKL